MEQEAARDLVRAREDGRGDLMRARHRLSKLLLRHGIVYSGGQAWTGAHDALAAPSSASTDAPALRLAFEAAYETVLATAARRDRLDAAIAAMAADSEFTPVVRRLGCLRGISTLTAFALAVEIGDWHRFTGATHRRLPRAGALASTPPAQSRSQGSITKTGNTHARRLLVEAAWHHRKPLPARRDHARPVGAGARQPRGPAATQGTSGCTSGGSGSPTARSGRVIANVADRPRARRLVLVPGRPRRVATAPRAARRPARRRRQREERPATQL